MKHFFTLIITFLSINFLQSQCDELFISEYVEGWSNNKAIEIYNPTANAIDLSGYSLSRYANGGQTPSSTQLEGTIEPYSTFVVGLDKRNPDGVEFEAPMWDGYFTFTDSITGEDVTIYTEEDDLQSKIDLFINPIYYTGTDPNEAIANPSTMYFNGNDAVTLEPIGAYPVDIFGKVNFDPGVAWVDNDGNYWTKDHTLIRKSSITGGETDPFIDFFDPTLEWDSLPANTFVNLGSHECECNPESKLLEMSNQFITYPNPTSQSVINIINNHEIQNVKVINHLGQVITNKAINNRLETHIELPNQKGIYIISVKDNFNTSNQSVVRK